MSTRLELGSATSLIVRWVIIGLLVSSAVVSQPEPRRYFPDERDPVWTPLSEILASDDPSAREILAKLVVGITRQRERGGDCLVTVAESDLASELRKESLASHLSKAVKVVEATVIDAEPGFHRSDPVTLLTLEVERENPPNGGLGRFHYLMSAFDAEIPGYGELCYSEAAPRVPPAGSTIVVFLASGGRHHDDWFVGSPADVAFVLAEGRVDAGPLFDGKLPPEARTPEGARTWLEKYLAGARGR